MKHQRMDGHVYNNNNLITHMSTITDMRTKMAKRMRMMTITPMMTIMRTNTKTVMIIISMLSAQASRHLGSH